MTAANFKLEQHVEILKHKSRISTKSFEGKIISITDHFITVQNQDGIKESFKYVDFSIGAIELNG